MAPLTGPEKGYFFGGAYFPKNGTFCPLLATIQPLSRARAFLLSQNMSRVVCMGCTFTAFKPLPLNNSPKQLSVSWESNPAHVIAHEKKNI
jgi:hypothetical protein